MACNGVVLIVDDLEEVLDSRKDFLEERGFLVLAYSEGIKVIDDLRNGLKYDVALVDLSLSDIGGDDIIRELKRYYPNRAVICVSGYANKPREADAMRTLNNSAFSL